MLSLTTCMPVLVTVLTVFVLMMWNPVSLRERQYSASVEMLGDTDPQPCPSPLLVSLISLLVGLGCCYYCYGSKKLKF